MSTYFNGFTELPKSNKKQTVSPKNVEMPHPEENTPLFQGEEAAIKLKNSVVCGKTRVILTNIIGNEPGYYWPMQGTEFECAGTIIKCAANPRYYTIEWDNGRISIYKNNLFSVIEGTTLVLPRNPNKGFRVKKQVERFRNQVGNAAEEVLNSMKKRKIY